ncbi:MAG: ribonuclease P protein component [Candidatus Pacebacteria bacterium]|nr:ribonuclease P protein component [Candidatus Paceibacterota bacterium]
MLAKSLKLNLSDPQTRKIFRSGLIIKTTNLIASYDHKVQSSKIGVVIAKKTLTLATQRNKWKRFIYDQVKLNLAIIKALPIAVIIRFIPKTSLISKAQLAAEVKEIFLKISKNEIFN